MPPLAQTAPAPHYGFATLGPFQDHPAAGLVGLGILALVVGAVALLYWRERASLSTLRMLPLLVLRFGSLAGVVLYALAPEKRDARLEVRPSRVLILVDDSLSMVLADTGDPNDAEPTPRWRTALRLLTEQGLLNELRKNHEVHVAPTSDARTSMSFPTQPDDQPQNSPGAGPPGEWEHLPELLTARTAQSRLGDALEHALAAYSGGPLAAMVLASDGQHNSGASPEMVATLAGEAGVPVHTIGLGSVKPQLNLAVRDFVAPKRAYPRDETALSALIEYQGPDPVTVVVSLFMKELGTGTLPDLLVETKSLTMSAEDNAKSVEFHTQPPSAGDYEFRVQVQAIEGEQSVEDNTAVAEMQVVDRLIKVLLIAGGPTRDYRFLRDQLRRDESFQVDVLLQSSPAGVSQNADNVLTSIPTDPEELSAYDLFLAFDADWEAIPASTIRAVEECVSRHGAGLMFATGPIHTPRWVRNGSAKELLDLLPVRPAPLPLLLGAAERSHPHPSQVMLTGAGREAAFLWVKRDRESSLRFWEEFPGFYSTATTDQTKPAATVYATTGEGSNGSRVLFAEQFYGSGRCFYVGAPEIWRLRAADPAVMRALYAKLLQHLSQGRLLANSSTGSLVFERDRYNVGDTLTLRATLPAASLAGRPQGQAVSVQIEDPRGTMKNHTLQSTGTSAGAWSASLRAEFEGGYKASLLLPGQQQPLSAKATVTVPALERSNTQRNAALLGRIAEHSGGNYYASIGDVLTGSSVAPALADAIPSRTETVTLYGAPDEAFAYRVARWLLTLISACLLTEWSLRRLWSLA